MFGWGKGNGKRGPGKHKRLRRGFRHRLRHQEPFNLNDAKINQKYIVRFNPDKKTIEMGIYAGSIISVQKNEFDDPNIIVAIGESRFIIPREIADQILIK